jgi:alkylhydroperoxidase/carboxymuconolactone decarboxylase family protein YurZ
LRFEDPLGRPIENGGTVESVHVIRKDLAEPTRRLREQIPDVMESYTDMQRALFTDGELPAKVKELIALAAYHEFAERHAVSS